MRSKLGKGAGDDGQEAFRALKCPVSRAGDSRDNRNDPTHRRERRTRTARKTLGKPIVYAALLQAPVTLSIEGFVKRTPSYSEGLGGKLSDSVTWRQDKW